MDRVYPAPTIVLGVGSFGLAVLERLGEDWLGLKLSGADETVSNLRLVSVRPENGAAARTGGRGEAEPTDACWRKRERPAARVAHLMGDGDLPSRALDLAVLRSLGLIRFRDGTYQLGLPRDDGPVEIPDASGDGGDTERTMRRRRYFDWVGLGSDPIVAAERLRQATERRQDVDLFVTPLLNRVRQGHSPRTVLATLGRCLALHRGLDPCPWRWLHERLPAGGPEEDHGGRSELPVDESIVGGFEAARDAEEHLASAPEPLPGWTEWLEHRAAGPGPEDPTPALKVPARFHPLPSVPMSPLDPQAMLGRDWRVSSWAGEESLAGTARFLPVPTTAFRLGFFDHDGRVVHPERDGDPLSADGWLRARLEELGTQVHRGLIRLWVDLQRTRASGPPGQGALRERSREHLAETLQQCLELLGELVIRPIASPSGPGGDRPDPDEAPSRPKSQVEERLPDEPSRFLTGMLVEHQAPDDPMHRLRERLGDLGLLDPGEIEVLRHPLLTDLRLVPEDIEEIERSELFAEAHEPSDEEEATPVDPETWALDPDSREARGARASDEGEAGRTGMQELRRALNHLVRQLFDRSHLARSRSRPTRQPPRLTVAVVGDVSEPFARAALRPILREIHAELLRAFTPIFQAYREGFDRSLCVTPILWMPHPADPFKGESLGRTRREEAAIIDTVHGIRHWVECVLPPGRRFIPQIFVNSRVTDVATLTIEEAIRQTRDFLSFQIRNDLSEAPWLRRITSGSGQDDLFSSFACREVEFPALRCREYLANRLARDLLEHLKSGGGRRGRDAGGPEPGADDPIFRRFEPPALEDLVGEPGRALRSIAAEAGERRRREVEERRVIDLRTWAWEIEEAWDEDFLQELQRAVHGDWRDLTGRQGEVDHLIDALRMQLADSLDRGLTDLRRHSNRLVSETLREGGLDAVRAGFEALRRKAREMFRAREALRSDRERLADRHTMPANPYDGLARARREIDRAARRKPDLLPMRFGLVVWGLLSAVLGAPLAHAVAYAFELRREPGVLELLLGPWGMVTGGLTLFLATWWLLSRHLRHLTRDVRRAVGSTAAVAKRLLAGSGNPLAQEAPFSIRGFLESRVELTAAVAVRSFSVQILERALADHDLAQHLVRSVDVQAHRLERRAEDLGVRKRPGEGPEGEDLSRLLGGSRDARYLIGEEDLKEYYKVRVPREEDLKAELGRFLPAAGGTDAWRERACLSDSERILGHGRGYFRQIAEHAASEQYSFADTLGPGLLDLVSSCYSTLGFGAEFRGFEGLDPDGIQVLTDAALVLAPELGRVFEKARSRDDAPPTTRTMQIEEVPIRSNAAYMLSLVQGIRVHSVRNLKRFESFHDRIRMPDDRTFPLTQETPEERTPPPINLVSAYEDLARELAESLEVALRRNGETGRTGEER